MKNDFVNLQLFIDEMQSTSSINNKKNILKKWKDNKFIMKILLYVNNPYITYGVTSSACKKFDKRHLGNKNNDIFDLLDDLRHRKLTGHAALLAVNTMVYNNIEHEQLIYNIIDKDIETRANTTLINKVIPGYIPEFKVALANVYEEKLVDFEKEEWYASRKLDGCVSYDSIVEFENGKKEKIGIVVNEKIEGKIKSYNTLTNKIEYKKIKDYMKNLDDINENKIQWYEIELENGNKLEITGNDMLFLPENGIYLRVDELTTGCEILFD